MNDSVAMLVRHTVPAEVEEFASEKGISPYLDAVIDLARKAFPTSTVSVSLGCDAEDESHKYIALDVEASGIGSAELLASQRVWSTGVGRICPSRFAVYFVLGWQ